ncbi:uncharacterized protein SPAPADRAFT_143874 [Spathaspora passalidarum NRRL Y-27907]|uniref:DUF3074 domain-containing protein n=1 Tax=Spathaspora passalidarum (strain NRRL Y-27907 / 11-Y1) TaxID=619300 RepID=G3AUL9_SPAPN|nr:uncharacterized protein SPAPADRAFT_143874 [Spathaspora passalidarum NRRL Y-27907]EGW30576.1 hypothetical protein SPAPADRAFT_143874 [Spathaspora passalidarum NRRL Y-27907]
MSEQRDTLVKESIAKIDSINKWHPSKTFNYSLESGGTVQVKTFKTTMNNQTWFARTSTVPKAYHDSLAKYIAGDSEYGKTHSDYEKEYIHEITSVQCTSLKQYSDGWNYQVKAEYDFGAFIKKRVFYELVDIYKGDGFIYVISSAAKPGSDETSSVVGTYDSIEKVSWEGDNLMWTMATTSNPGGLIPGWLTNLSMPGAISKDVPSVLNWIGGKN